jgi:nitroreductase
MSRYDQKLTPIFSRRSIRKYTDTAIDDERIEAILKAAMAAPSACGKDPWRFLVVRKREMLKKIADGLPNGKMLASAGAGIVVCGDIDAAHDRQMSYMLQDCSAAIENMLCAVSILDLGACWLGVHPREERITHIRETFSLSQSIVPIACIALGFPVEQKEPRSRYRSDFIHYETW